MSKIKTLYHRVLLSFNKALVFSKKKVWDILLSPEPFLNAPFVGRHTTQQSPQHFVQIGAAGTPYFTVSALMRAIK